MVGKDTLQVGINISLIYLYCIHKKIDRSLDSKFFKDKLNELYELGKEELNS